MKNHPGWGRLFLDKPLYSGCMCELHTAYLFVWKGYTVTINIGTAPMSRTTTSGINGIIKSTHESTAMWKEKFIAALLGFWDVPCY